MLDGGRRVLQAAGLHADRVWFKLALGLVLGIAFAVAGVRFLRAPRRRAAAVAMCHAGLAMQAVLLCIETTSLDDALPRAVTRQPGRYLYEGTCAAVALVGAWAARPPAGHVS